MYYFLVGYIILLICIANYQQSFSISIFFSDVVLQKPYSNNSSSRPISYYLYNTLLFCYYYSSSELSNGDDHQNQFVRNADAIISQPVTYNITFVDSLLQNQKNNLSL